MGGDHTEDAAVADFDVVKCAVNANLVPAKEDPYLAATWEATCLTGRVVVDLTCSNPGTFLPVAVRTISAMLTAEAFSLSILVCTGGPLASTTPLHDSRGHAESVYHHTAAGHTYSFKT